MPVLLAAALGSIIRYGLIILADRLVQHNIWTSGQAEQYVSAFVIFLLTYAWSLWTTYKNRIKFLTALQVPSGKTEVHVETLIAQNLGASLSSPLGK